MGTGYSNWAAFPIVAKARTRAAKRRTFLIILGISFVNCKAVMPTSRWYTPRAYPTDIALTFSEKRTTPRMIGGQFLGASLTIRR